MRAYAKVAIAVVGLVLIAGFAHYWHVHRPDRGWHVWAQGPDGPLTLLASDSLVANESLVSPAASLRGRAEGSFEEEAIRLVFDSTSNLTARLEVRHLKPWGTDAPLTSDCTNQLKNESMRRTYAQISGRWTVLCRLTFVPDAPGDRYRLDWSVDFQEAVPSQAVGYRAELGSRADLI